MRDSHSDAYKKAGVDITAGYRGVELMKEHIARTMIDGSGGIGGFGGTFELTDYVKTMKSPILVSGTDGVGTKIRISQLMEKYDTIGIDCVAMCVNDIVCTGAQPLFFLDYIAIGKNEPEKVAQIVAGVAEGCVEAGCALVGGETAEHPDLMAPDDFDVAGFSVGLVDKDKMLGPSRVQEGDLLIALMSSGLHSNGYSLVRKVFDVENANLDAPFRPTGRTLGEELLRPTKIYVKAVLAAAETGYVASAAHITGGGLVENLPRCLPDGLEAVIDYTSWRVPPIFEVLQERGDIPEDDMRNTFNMGIGMVLVCHPGSTKKIMEAVWEHGADAVVIGSVAAEGNSKS